MRVQSNSQLMKVHPMNSPLVGINKEQTSSISTIHDIKSEEHKIMEGEFVYPLGRQAEVISEPRFDEPLLVTDTADIETKYDHKNNEI